jgi:hypothetical protein
MKKDIFFWLSLISFLVFVSFAYYLHHGFVDFINDVLYSNDKIPSEHKKDLYYFMEEKIRFRDISVLIFFLSSLLSFLFLWSKSKLTITKGILILQAFIVIISILIYNLRIGIYVT